MKETDLMIGDWVLDNRVNVPLRVSPFMAQLEVPEWSPIPLTIEILEKNGFRYELDYGSFYRSLIGDSAKEKEPYVSVRWNSNGKVCCWEVSNKPSFMEGAVAYGYSNIAVHTLQHALRLCGLEELADNFKV